ncbi:MAG: NTP transferase domain-containing protein [Myxococcota bacterium]|nr:NTP transferase domain-containing protein [Myxococcota bacterium]
MAIPAIVTAGDGRAAKAVYGENKVFLPVAGRPMVVRLVSTLQSVPEVSEVWVVGRRARLEEIFNDEVRGGLSKPLFLVEQGRNLLENAWETYRRTLSRDLEKGRDPVGDEVDQAILYLSGDLPFATSQELSAFIRQGLAIPDCDYALGLAPAAALEGFKPASPGAPGIDVAFFNLREGRLRQNNLHLARPARLGKRDRIEDMYEHRHQKKFGNMAVLAWKLFFSRAAGPWIVLLYLLMHGAGWADRWKLRRLAAWLRSGVTLARNESVISRVLDTRFHFVITEAGGCAIDVDTEAEYDAVELRFDEWKSLQDARSEALYGPPALAAPRPQLDAADKQEA